MPFLLLFSYVSYAEPSCPQGTIDYIRFDMLNDGTKYIDTVVIKLSSMNHEAYTDRIEHRQTLLYAYAVGEKVELHTNSCNADFIGFAKFSLSR